MATIPATHDDLFEELRGSVPLQFLRALGWMESRLNPAAKTGKHWGLFQAGPENLSDYNATKGTSYGSDYLLDARVNTQVFLWELRRILRSLAAGGLPPDWGDDSFVAIVVMAWNAGWSKRGGVRRVLDYLRQKGLPLDYETIASNAAKAGAASTLSSVAKQQWQRATAALYRQLERAPSDPIAPTAAAKLQAIQPAGRLPGRLGDWGWLAILLGIVYLTDIKKR